MKKIPALVLACCAAPLLGNAQRAEPAEHHSYISVLTYNVHGLPWPMSDRRAALIQIGERLKMLRFERRQPQVVMLQEAFTADAEQIGRIGGYRYIAHGPGRLDDGAGRTRWAGFSAVIDAIEDDLFGKAVDSGIEILSDYPILSTRSLAFPSGMCAGFDCLANKGVLLATVALPGAPHPMALITTHLNSRRAAGTAIVTADRAYQRQLAVLDKFLDGNRDPQEPMIFAGDFNNAGPRRSAMLLQHAAGPWKMSGACSVRQAVQTALNPALLPPGPLHRNKDWQFYAYGGDSRIVRLGSSLPFGTEKDGSMLSDHFGYAVSYRIDWRVAGMPASAKITSG